MKAALILSQKEIWADGMVSEMVVWQLPEPTPERPHGLKYRMHCGRDGRCLVRYDNETGKGDHVHYGEREVSYQFISLARLVADFEADVKRLTEGD
jgi:uncharacterized protein YwbE